MAELEDCHDAEPVGQSVPRHAVDLSGIHSTMQRNRTTFTQIRSRATQTTSDARTTLDFLTLISLACEIYRTYGSELVEMESFRRSREQSEGGGGNCVVTRREIKSSSPSSVSRGLKVWRNESIIVKRTRRAFWGSDKSALRSFIAELRVRAHPPLRMHPNIVDLKGIAWDFEDEERRNPCPLLLEERASEGSLEQFWKARNLTRMPFKIKVALCSDIANGLSALHKCGIVHGDVKPENILVFPQRGSQEAYTAKLTDFGHSVLAYENLDAPPALTPQFSAPELEEQSSFSFLDMKQTDVYSYGLVVLCVVMGRDCCSDFGSMLLSYKLDDSIIRRATRLLEREDRQNNDSDFDLTTLGVLFNSTLKRDSKQRDLQRCIKVLYRYTVVYRLAPNRARIKLVDQSFESLSALPIDLVVGYRTLSLCSFLMQEKVFKELSALALEDPDPRQGAACWELCICYFSGFGTKQNFLLSSYWLYQAAERGILGAQAYFIRLHQAMKIEPVLALPSNDPVSQSSTTLDTTPRVTHGTKAKWLSFASIGGYSESLADLQLLDPELHAATISKIRDGLVKQPGSEDFQQYLIAELSDRPVDLCEECQSIAVRIVTAAASSDFSHLRVLVNTHEGAVNFSDSSGNTALITAARCGQLKIRMISAFFAL